MIVIPERICHPGKVIVHLFDIILCDINSCLDFMDITNRMGNVQASLILQVITQEPVPIIARCVEYTLYSIGVVAERISTTKQVTVMILHHAVD